MAVLLLCGLALGACTRTGAKLFRPPASIRGDTAFTDSVPPALRTTEATIFYATDRATRGESYGAQRNGALRLGAARVRYGRPQMTWDELADRTIEGRIVTLHALEFHEFGALSTTVPALPGQVVSTEGERAFADALNAAMAESGDRTVTVFVHGFNSSFHWGLYKSATLWHYARRRGVVMVYSWPAYAHPFAYARDRESGWVTSRSLREFLAMLAEQTDVERINVLTYSAGASVVTDALHQMRLAFADADPKSIRAATRIKEVVLAGPDMSFHELQAGLLDGMHEVAERVTIYTSRIDGGLWLSSFFYFHGPRLGWGDRGMTEEQQRTLLAMEGISLIDVQSAQQAAGSGDIWAHAYWYGNPWVSNDLLRILTTSAPPQQRGLVGEDGQTAWRFPDLYADLVAPWPDPAGTAATEPDRTGASEAP